MRITILLILCTITSCNFTLAQSWEEVGNLNPRAFDYGGIILLNSEEGWAWNNNKIAKTFDGGESWVDTEIEAFGRPLERFLDLHFFDSQTGFLLREGNDWSVMLKTGDGGNTWELLQEYAPGEFFSISPLVIRFFTETIGIIGCRDGRILRTSDGGNIWREVASPVLQDSAHITDIELINSAEAWMVSTKGMALKTVDQGLSWEKVDLNQGDIYLADVLFLTENRGFISGQNGTALRTNDGGNSWQIIESGRPDNSHILQTINFRNTELGFIGGGFGITGRTLYTLDGGNSWIRMNHSTEVLHLTGISSIENGPTVAMSLWGRVYKLNPEIPYCSDFDEVDIYPNPSDDVITIAGQLAGCRIRFLTPSGELVHEVHLEANASVVPVSSLARGWYLLEVISDNHRATYKMVKN